MTDDDVVVTCRCGKVELLRKGGYHECDLDDLRWLGTVASTACEGGYRHPFSFHLPLITGAFLVLLLTPLWWLYAPKASHGSVAVQDRRGEVVMLLNRAFLHYRDMQYDHATDDIAEALKLDPANEAALRNREILTYVVGKLDHASTRQSSD